MEILELINSYIKYVYIFLILVIIIIVIKMLLTLTHIGKSSNDIKEDIDYIKIYGQQLKEKSEIIDNTTKTSLPFFFNIFVGISLISGVLQDYFDTKASKRSLRKSVEKVYRYHNSKDTAFKALSRNAVKFVKH